MTNKFIYSLIFSLISICCFSQIKITEVYYDTPYNERMTLFEGSTQQENGARKHHWGEFIELYNYTDRDLSLKDWYIRDYVGTFWLPDVTIKSEGFVVLVYSQLLSNTTPFTELFSTTAGKEAQIIRQDKILLRNKSEGLELGYKPDGKIPFPVADNIYTGTNQEPSSNRKRGAWQYPHICYEVPSVQLVSANKYEKVTPPNPLDATYKPPTQNYETLMADLYQQYYAYLDWSENVANLVNAACPISIAKIEQVPSGIYDTGKKCFDYDLAGNNTSSSDCTSLNPPNDPQTGEYNTDELEAIKNSIVVYPNPATSGNQYNVTISWNGPAIDKINSIQVYNSSGGMVYGYTPVSGTNSTTFSLQNQLSGMFFANFILNTGQVISKNILKW